MLSTKLRDLMKNRIVTRGLALLVVSSSAVLLVLTLLFLARQTYFEVHAAPIDPPEGYPKFILSQMSVSPELVSTGGATLLYSIEIVNTGAYTGHNVVLSSLLPAHATYNNDATSSSLPDPVVVSDTLTWTGTVGFDSSIVISYTVNVLPDYEGEITSTAEISYPEGTEPVQLFASAMVTDNPLFEVSKTSAPRIPGPGKPITYTLSVTNRGQPAVAVPVTVTDQVPTDTTFSSYGADGSYDSLSDTVTWMRQVSLDTGESSEFTFSVLVDDVLSGTVITNDSYLVSSTLGGVSAGEVYTVTVLDPILFLYKDTDPFPPGSNREMTYTLTVLNKGSLAEDLVVSDTVPAGVTYKRGGTLVGDVVQWTWTSLDTGESAQFEFVVEIGDVAEVEILNDNYQVCSIEGVCQLGIPLTSIVKGPTFETDITLDPIAKKPGGGGGPVTPTLVLHNLGPGNALDLTALIYFGRISVSMEDMLVIPAPGGDPGDLDVGPDCGEKCDSFVWVGDLSYEQAITFTVNEGQSTIGGEEGTPYTATLIVTDTLGAFTTQPITTTATGRITHFANLIPTKSAPPVIGAGQTMTYSIQVFNSGLSTDDPPFPVLTDTVPVSTTLANVNDDGISYDISGTTVVSWTLPAMSPGDRLYRSYSVVVDEDLISGTLIVNEGYRAMWYDVGALITETFVLSNTGVPVTTVVKEIGLVDSFKTVTPTRALPAPGNLLTYTVHVVNSSPVSLNGVRVYDLMPWQVSTYQRDAVATAGQVVSDIVSLDWVGDLAPFSQELVTFAVVVDPYYEGPVTNTVVITHSSLRAEVVENAVAYITDDPVLRIRKVASPSPVYLGNELLYTIRVANLGSQATELVVTDTVPANTSFVPFSASGNGQFDGQQVRWEFPVLLSGEERVLSYRVQVNGFGTVINSSYGVTCAEGVTAFGEPVVTPIRGGTRLMLPLLFKR